MKTTLSFIRKYFAVLVIVVAFTWSAFCVASYRIKEHDPKIIEIRLAHWQLETGVRQGLEALAEDYHRLHPNVRIVLDNVPENVYGQWVTTQLTGSNAPDLLEMGVGLPGSVWLAFQSRYLTPFSSYLSDPNPYNAGTDLESRPWRNTFQNGLLQAYSEQLQDYMGIQLSQLNSRLFYNKSLLKKLTGLDEPPTNYREFLKVCEKIKTLKDEKGRKYIAISSSRAHFPMWDSMMCGPLTWSTVRTADFNKDGYVDTDEGLIAFQKGLISFQSPPFQARFKIVREICDEFQPGFTGLQRDDGVFLFAQQRAVFISAGGFDYQSLIDQAKGAFELGFIKFPIPSKDDPEFGKLVEGPFYENQPGAFTLGLTRASKHQDVAIDFLKFLTAQRQNEKLNQIMGWMPITYGAKPLDFLSRFKPETNGMYDMSGFMVASGGEIQVRWEQLYALYRIGRISLEDFGNQFESYYLQYGKKNYEERLRDWKRAILRNEHMLGALRYRAIHAPEDQIDDYWLKYRLLTWGRQLAFEIYNNRIANLVNQGQDADVKTSYEFSPGALENISKTYHLPVDEIKSVNPLQKSEHRT